MDSFIVRRCLWNKMKKYVYLCFLDPIVHPSSVLFSVIEIVLNMSLIISGGVNTFTEKVSSFTPVFLRLETGVFVSCFDSVLDHFLC